MHLNLALLLSATVLVISASAQTSELTMDTVKSKSYEQALYSCPVCFTSYTRRHNLKTHFRGRHQAQEKNYPEVFRTIKSTKTNKLWPCPIASCVCGFTRKGDLKLHFCRKHPDVVDSYPYIMKGKSSKTNKAFTCPFEQCPSGYMRKNNLKTHLQIKHGSSFEQNWFNDTFFGPNTSMSLDDEELDDTYSEANTNMSLDDDEELDDTYLAPNTGMNLDDDDELIDAASMILDMYNRALK